MEIKEEKRKDQLKMKIEQYKSEVAEIIKNLIELWN